ncbi:PREDICTED: ribonuclease P protein subunit p38-like [Ceratosolen solmsi marchali]|uniref:Ribonuclease P protein subunit p38-like n=1 Tax=Ceratosolen solmsi marchali TaxID=326594 RepID=A0AAJ6YX50_9HYME|nr:PREDICTED: ribonuclease P protein subunit p38-like [Ceratosolen solmsi marchali]
MATPILSKPQQRKSLSAKKTPIRGLKNVLGQPFEMTWPHLQNDQDSVLENLLRKLLIVLKPAEHKISWSKLYKMNKEERSAAKKAALSSCTDNSNKFNLNSVIFGINKVTRSLEKDDVSCILLDANVDPKLLVKHIVQMAELKGVPTLLISFLKIVTLDTIGFASAAVALKKQVQTSPDDYFYSLFEKISELSLEFVNLKRPVRLFEENLPVDELIPKQTQKQKTNKDDNESEFDNVFLIRKSKKERVFIPPTSKMKKETEKVDLNFIPLSDDKQFVHNEKMPSRFFEAPILGNPKSDKPSNSEKNSDNEGSNDSDNVVSNNSNNEVSQRKGGKRKLKRTTEHVNQDKVIYQPLKVKRVQGNEFRSKATKLSKQKRKQQRKTIYK